MVTKINKRLIDIERVWLEDMFAEASMLIDKLVDRLYIILSIEERKILGTYFIQTLSYDVFLSRSGDPQLDEIVVKARSDPETNAIIDEFINFSEKNKHAYMKDYLG